MINAFEKENYSKINVISEDEDNNNIRTKLVKKNNLLMNKNNTLKNIIVKNYILNNFCFLKCFLILLIIFFIFAILIGSILKIHNKSIDNMYKIVQNAMDSKTNKDNSLKSSEKIIKDKKKNNINKSTKSIQIEEEQTTEKEEKEKEKEKEEEIEPKKEDIYKEEKYDSLNEAFNKAKDFLDKCMKGISLHDKPFISSEKPKVSAVIPLYNSRNFISRALKSIQNQNLLDLEIVLVNDCSTDDTLSIVENIQKTDPRIKIVKNKKNMGIIYSRSIGALSAKGKYIFPLDNDDLFLDKDVFEEITKVADKGNFDIVEFKGVFSLIGGNNLLNNRIQDTYFSGHKLNLVMFQPELGNYPLKITNKMGEFEIIDNFLWVKCIKSKIYQKALNKLGQERYSRHMIMHEDLLVIYILFNTAQSYKFIGKYGTFHIQVAGSASWRSFRNAEMNLYNLYVVDVAIDFSQETRENKKILVYLITFMIDRPQLENTLSDDKNKKLFISCLDRILNCKFISDEDKNIIRKRGKKLTFLNYPF